MPKKDPLDPIFQEIREVLAFLYENAGKPLDTPLSPEMEKRLTLLENVVDKLKEASEEELKKAGLTLPVPTPEIMKKLSIMPEKDRKAFETSMALGREAGSLYLSFLTARREVEDISNKSKDKNPTPTKKESVQRKAKFKKTTGDQKWKKI